MSYMMYVFFYKYSYYFYLDIIKNDELVKSFTLFNQLKIRQ